MKETQLNKILNAVKSAMTTPAHATPGVPKKVEWSQGGAGTWIPKYYDAVHKKVVTTTPLMNTVKQVTKNGETQNVGVRETLRIGTTSVGCEGGSGSRPYFETVDQKVYRVRQEWVWGQPVKSTWTLEKHIKTDNTVDDYTCDPYTEWSQFGPYKTYEIKRK